MAEAASRSAAEDLPNRLVMDALSFTRARYRMLAGPCSLRIGYRVEPIPTGWDPQVIDGWLGRYSARSWAGCEDVAVRADLSRLENPPLVRRALVAAESLGFSQSCSPEVGHLLCLLAATHREGDLLEVGTGAGVGAAWLATGMAPSCRLVTVEEDLERARAAATVFADVDTVEVLRGDWRQINLPKQVRLMFIDAHAGKWSE